MTDFPMCSLCGHTIAITRERDETKPTPAELRARIERLAAALEGMLMEWDKLTRYGSPMAKAANERVSAARAALARKEG